jgi:hypothetical protein
MKQSLARAWYRDHRPITAAENGGRSRGQVAGFGLQPLADVPGAPLTIGRPFLREAIVDDIVPLDTERVLDDLGGAVAVVSVDRLCEKIGHGGTPY